MARVAKAAHPLKSKLTEGFKNIHGHKVHDPRNKKAALAAVTLPKSVDLKADVFEVEDQGDFSSCTANAGCSALELMYKHKGTPVDLSRMFLYYYDRQLGGIKGDEGAYPKDIGNALLKYGTCLESTWGYDKAHLTEAPSAAAIAEAEKFKIVSYEQLADTDKLTQIKTALAQGIPVLVAIDVYKGMYDLTGSWKTHTWNYKKSTTNKPEGGHEVLCIGYDDESKHLLIENSWGPGWADGGFFGIPYDMVSTNAFGECWIVNPNFNNGVTPVTPVTPVVDPVTPVVPPKGFLEWILEFILSLFKK